MTAKICLINPPTTSMESLIYFPMGLVALGSYLKGKGIDVEIIDFDLELRKDSSLLDWNSFKNFALKKLCETKAGTFGISSICNNFPASILLAREIRNEWPLSRIILGGPQPSAVAEKTLRSYPWIDLIVVGEGEITLYELMLADGSRSLKEIDGIVYKSQDQILRSPPRALIDNLDELPVPAYSLIPLKEYFNPFQFPDLIEAGRGCPFLCSFCSTSLMWERKYRAKSPARILKEIRKVIKDYKIEACLGITHDNFTTSFGYVTEFCDFFEKNNREGLMWSASARPDTVNPKRIRELQKAGCRGLFFGVDTGSERMQKIIHKNLKLPHFKKVLKEAVAQRISATTSLIIGYPEETEDEVNETLSLA